MRRLRSLWVKCPARDTPTHYVELYPSQPNPHAAVFMPVEGCPSLFWLPALPHQLASKRHEELRERPRGMGPFSRGCLSPLLALQTRP